MGYIVTFEIFSLNSQLPLIYKDFHLTTGKILSSALTSGQKISPGDEIPPGSVFSLVIDDRKNEELLSKYVGDELHEVVWNGKPFSLSIFENIPYLLFQHGSS